MPNVKCPKCRTPFNATAGQSSECPGCGSRFRAKATPSLALAAKGPEADETVMVLEQPTPPPPDLPAPVVEQGEREIVKQDGAPTSRWREAFKPREYPSMRLIIAVLRALAILTALSFFGSIVLTWVSTLQKSRGGFFDVGMNGVVALIFMTIISLLIHGFFVVVFMAAAESIKVLLDIQTNTEETAFHSRP